MEVTEKTEQKQPLAVEIVKERPPHQFQPGQSGNPAGKPKGARHMATLLREAITKVANDQGETVDKQMIKALYTKAKNGDLKALEIVLDRVDGKPLQEIDITSGGETIGINAEQRAKLDSLLSM